MKIRVYYEDTDAAGIVYYANYLKFCERARSELFFSNGLTPQSEKGYFVVKSIEANYIQPAMLGDTVIVETEMIEKKAASIVLIQQVKRDETLLFEMKIRLAYLQDGKPAKIPLQINELISLWQKQ
ncbi:YbgC/FadM family acyl-CoA thioesterase [Hydrogenimonas thermophila]|uniref:Acyl-CoA thioester hydrolase n=1 Tax=Hydrogenimonas thermophila TaxID=223786 RepID=A0A1I5TBL2_9BACT|nr:YbgC/FadM family acyl-CoA thioesterase [Hydrogenimonas thermophila]SFP80435.1 acyl-CoA thioester hydrolase [Hydrogenimonas thermophila]